MSDLEIAFALFLRLGAGHVTVTRNARQWTVSASGLGGSSDESLYVATGFLCVMFADALERSESRDCTDLRSLAESLGWRP